MYQRREYNTSAKLRRQEAIKSLIAKIDYAIWHGVNAYEVLKLKEALTLLQEKFVEVLS